MSDRDTAPEPSGSDPLDRAYADAEAMLADDAARAARRARVLGAVAKAEAAVEAPRAATWPGLGRGGWLAAAGVAGLAVFVSLKLLPLQTSRFQPQPRPEPQPQAASQSPAPPGGPAEGAAPPPVTGRSPRPLTAGHAPQTASTPPHAEAAPISPASTPPASTPPPAGAASDAMAEGKAGSEVVVTGQRRAETSSRDARPRAFPADPLADRAHVSARLHAAAAAGRTDEVKSLLAEGMAVDEPDARGDTALMLSVRGGHPETAALLRRQGAALDRKNHAGESVRDMAAELDDPRMDRALGLKR